MKNITKIYILFQILMATISGYSQNDEARSLLKKVNDFYKNQTVYQIDMNFKMYQGLTGDKITELYEGKVFRKDSIARLNMANSELLQIGKDQIAIDHDQKLIVFRKAPINSILTSVIDVSTFMEIYETSSIKNFEDTIRLELISKKDKTSSPFAKIVLFIDKSSYEMVKQEMIFTNQMPFKNEKGNIKADFGRLHTEMKLNKNIDDQSILSFDHYFNKDKDGKVLLQPAYKEYEIIEESE